MPPLVKQASFILMALLSNYQFTVIPQNSLGFPICGPLWGLPQLLDVEVLFHPYCYDHIYAHIKLYAHKSKRSDLNPLVFSLAKIIMKHLFLS